MADVAAAPETAEAPVVAVEHDSIAHVFRRARRRFSVM